MITSTGCAVGSEPPPAGGESAPEVAVESALEGTFFREEGTARRGESVLGIRFAGADAADVLFSYRGSEERIETSCRAAIRLERTDAHEMLTAECPDARRMTFAIERGDPTSIVLTNALGESMRLAKVDPSFRGTPRLECDAPTFSARIDVTSDGTRALLQTSPKAGADAATPPSEISWLARGHRFEGFDLKRNQYDFALPRSFDGSAPLTLGYQGGVAAVQRMRHEYRLTCRVAS